MLLEFSRAGGGAHSQIFQGPTKAHLLMSLEMGHHQKGVGEGHGGSDLCALHINAVHGDFHLVRAAEAIGNDHRCSRSLEHKSVLVRGKKVIHGIGAGSGVEGIGIGEERFCPKFLELIYDHSNVIGAKIREVSKLAEVQFDRHQLPGPKDLGKPGLKKEKPKFLKNVHFRRGGKIGEPDGAHGGRIIRAFAEKGGIPVNSAAMTLAELARAAEEIWAHWEKVSGDLGSLEDLEAVRVQILGRKGSLTQLFSALRELPPEEKAEAGKILNALKARIEKALEEKKEALAEAERRARLAQERYDLSLPGKWRPLGKLHPLTQVRREIEEIFLRLGFDVASGPEIETEYYNFEALNIGADHPARDEWDSFYLGEGILLRTHTSPVQIRVMKERKPPVRIICPGRCFRRDNPDATHSPVFHQVELLWVEQGLTFAHLKWVIGEFVREFFGPGYEMRFSADYFPFTEPSAQVHIRKKGTQKWLEIMGAGMVHPRVLEEVGYDPEEVTGFAFGLGIERMAMLRWGIEDIRLFWTNDLRFLSQF